MIQIAMHPACNSPTHRSLICNLPFPISLPHSSIFQNARQPRCRATPRASEDQMASTLQRKFSQLLPPCTTPKPASNSNNLPIPLPQETGVRQIAAEIKELLEPFLDIVTTHRDSLQTNPSFIAGVVVYFRSIQRNKRCALAYLQNRLQRIISYRWAAGPSTSARLGDNLSGQEQVFLNKYNALLGAYSDAVNLDLTADAQPPRDLYVEVRVLSDCGSVLTDSGPVALKPGTAHFLKRADVEHLIRQGALQHIV